MFVSAMRFLNPLVLPTFRLNSLTFNVTSHDTRRGYTNRADCPEYNMPRCSPEKMKNVVCEDPKSTPWYKPECCFDPCPDAMPRFDDLYYKPRTHRKYTRTWVDCPKMFYATKKVCCLKDVKPPQFERRPAKCHHGKECNLTSSSATLIPCHKLPLTKCTKVVMPLCKQSRDPPQCIKIRHPSDCKKVCTPYPSFSECMKPEPKRKHPIECNCLIVRPFCHN